MTHEINPLIPKSDQLLISPFSFTLESNAKSHETIIDSGCSWLSKKSPCQYQRECVGNSVVKCILVLGCKGLIYQWDTYLWIQVGGWEGGMRRRDGEGDWGKGGMRKAESGRKLYIQTNFFTHSVPKRKTSTASFLWYGTNNEVNFLVRWFLSFFFCSQCCQRPLFLMLFDEQER